MGLQCTRLAAVSTYRWKCYCKRDSLLENCRPKQPQQKWLGIMYITELGNYCGSVGTSRSLLAALLLHLHPGIAKKLFHRLMCRWGQITSKDKGSVDVNVKLFLCLIRHRDMKVCEEDKLQIYVFLTSALDWCERLASRQSWSYQRLSGHSGKKSTSLLRGIKPQFLGQVLSLLTILTILSRLLWLEGTD